jgi:membrane protein
MYKVLPAANNSWRSAFVGGAVASVLFEVAKRGVAVFLLRPNHGIYGGFADLIVVFLWVYYSTTILIIGSEAAAVYARHFEASAGARLRLKQHLASGAARDPD